VLDISNIMKPRLTGIIQNTCYDRSGWIETEGIPEYFEIKDDIIYILNTQGEVSIRKICDFKSMNAAFKSEDAEAEKTSGSSADNSQNAGLNSSGDNDQNMILNNSGDSNQNSGSKSSGNKTAYITIDDGPSRSNTTKNLDTLKKYGVKATFFVLPHDNLDDVYKRIIEEGNVIGSHGCVHDYSLLYGSLEGFEKDVTKARDYIYKKLGYTSTVYRFPGGSMGHKKGVIDPRAELLGELGYRYFDWDVSTADTDPNLKKYGTEEQIVNLLANNVIKGAKGKKKLIILMHDSAGKYYSAKALPKIIEGLKKQGYTFDVLTNY
jgi:peptidoglycan/xylan/chitin deacetylase (PgdA/CDA1 family)